MTISGWTITAIGGTILAAMLLFRAEPQRRRGMLITGLLSSILVATQEAVPATRAWGDRTGMGLIGPIPVEIVVLFLSMGVITQYIIDRAMPWASKWDLIRSFVVLAVEGIVILAVGEGGSIVYPLGCIAIIGLIMARHRIRLILMALGGLAGGLIFEYAKHDTLFHRPTAVIVAMAVLCLGIIMREGEAV